MTAFISVKEGQIAVAHKACYLVMTDEMYTFLDSKAQLRVVCDCQHVPQKPVFRLPLFLPSSDKC